MAKSKKYIYAKKAMGFHFENLNQSEIFFIFETKKAFKKLRQMFIETLILNHFDLERHIWIKTDVSGYTIGKILSQLTLNNLGW